MLDFVWWVSWCAHTQNCSSHEGSIRDARTKGPTHTKYLNDDGRQFKSGWPHYESDDDEKRLSYS
jgi:hypothetical protein